MGEKGFSLIDTLFGLALSATLIAAAGTLIFPAIKGLLSTVGLHRQVATDLRARNMLSDLISALDTHRFNFGIKIHPGAAIKYTSGADNPVTNGKTAPLKGSDAVSALELDRPKTLWINERSISGTNLQVFACARWSERPAPAEATHFLGLGPGAQLELIGKAKAHIGRKDCLDLELHAEPSMIIPELGEISFISELIPIKREFTLYLDGEGQLRFLGHQGAKNIENQPVIRNISGLKLALNEAWSGVFSLSAEITHKHGKKDHYELVSKISRLAVYQQLLSRP